MKFETYSSSIVLLKRGRSRRGDRVEMLNSIWEARELFIKENASQYYLLIRREKMCEKMTEKGKRPDDDKKKNFEIFIRRRTKRRGKEFIREKILLDVFSISSRMLLMTLCFYGERARYLLRRYFLVDFFEPSFFSSFREIRFFLKLRYRVYSE